MKRILFLLTLMLLVHFGKAQSTSPNAYQKRVLETPEIELLMSYYQQDGDHSAVGGGIGDESLDDVTPTIVITLPLNDNDVLTIDAGLSAYTSASSSNINPFNSTGASGRGGDDEEDEDDYEGDDEDDFRPGTSGAAVGTPWLASSGASKSDVLASVSLAYSHSSDDRNWILGLHGSVSKEYDYHSLGFGGSVARLFAEKNTELSLKTQVYLDAWKPIYPTELHEYSQYGSNFLNSGYFEGMTVLNEQGNPTTAYLPNLFSEWDSKKRNSYSASLGLSQIFSRRLQASFFVDLIYQKGLLSTPYHRIYFADRPNYYIGNASDIPVYTSRENTGVFRLADEVERLPDTRLKIPFGARINYYLSQTFKLRTYYRYYTDDWGITAHTGSVELPVSLSPSFTLTPTYRYYEQTAASYFAPFETHVSTEQYYTSDYDLADFQSNQYGIGLSYTNIFSKPKLFNLGLKNVNLRFSHYDRSDGLKANIVSFGLKYVFE
ncbi:DUF3570 domain-containing protein [Sunxiuqinia rutila]|uniref:DUF3570 domain-containing protein n=1 Tax=Sunxiuqinia rutila TaxID=1397841 RepID=UPI003D36E136